MNPFPLLKRKAWYTHRELTSSKGMHPSKNMYLIFLGIPATGCVQHYNCTQVASKGVKLFLHLVLYWSGTRGMTWCASICRNGQLETCSSCVIHTVHLFYMLYMSVTSYTWVLHTVHILYTYCTHTVHILYTPVSFLLPHLTLC